jgi:hypothetical protein
VHEEVVAGERKGCEEYEQEPDAPSEEVLETQPGRDQRRRRNMEGDSMKDALALQEFDTSLACVTHTVGLYIMSQHLR